MSKQPNQQPNQPIKPTSDAIAHRQKLFVSEIASPPSISAFKKYGVHSSNVRYSINNLPRYPTAIIETLEDYFLLFWSSDYFIQVFNKGMILRDHIEYQVIFKDTNYAAIKRDVESNNVYSQLSMSFRVPAKEYKACGILPTVLISIRSMPSALTPAKIDS